MDLEAFFDLGAAFLAAFLMVFLGPAFLAAAFLGAFGAAFFCCFLVAAIKIG